MNAIQEAFSKAGVPVKALRERAWQIVKDNGPTTVKALASRMNIDEKQAQQTLSNLASKGCLESSGKLGWGGVSTYTALGKTYAEARAYGRKPVKVTSIAPAPQPASDPTPPPKTGLASLPKEVEGFTIAELRALHNTLRGLFG